VEVKEDGNSRLAPNFVVLLYSLEIECHEMFHCISYSLIHSCCMRRIKDEDTRPFWNENRRGHEYSECTQGHI
jgi:hypothetical protein